MSVAFSFGIVFTAQSTYNSRMEPRYSVTNSIITSLGKIEAARAIIENSALVPLWERQFREEAVLRAVHHSTHVEGNPLSKHQAQQVLDGKSLLQASAHHVQEVINYRKVVQFIEDIYEDHTKPITLDTILRLHQLVMEDILDEAWLGKYRREPALVRNSITGAVVFTPPSESELDSLMDAFVKWIWRANTDDLHPVLKAGVIHYQMVYIHPFMDGNGRTARALSTLSLYKDRYDIKRFFCLDEYFDYDSIGYYSALRATDERQDFTPWLEYFAYGLAQELMKVKGRVLELSRDARLRKVIGQIALNERQEQIMLFVERYGRIANKDWRILFPSISDDTILRDIKFLQQKKMLKKKGSTKASYYELL